MTKEQRHNNGLKRVTVLEQLDMRMKKVHLDTDRTSFTKIHTNWNRDLNIKCKTKIPEDDTGEKLDDLGYDNAFLDTTKAQSMKEITEARLH